MFSNYLLKMKLLILNFTRNIWNKVLLLSYDIMYNDCKLRYSIVRLWGYMEKWKQQTLRKSINIPWYFSLSLNWIPSFLSGQKFQFGLWGPAHKVLSERVNSKIHTAGLWITILFMGLRFEGVKDRNDL